MSEDIIKSLFLKCQDQYDSACRWSFIILLIALLFHLMTFSQFIDLGKKNHAVQVEQVRLSNLDKAVDKISSGLSGLKKTINKSLEVRLDKLMLDLRNDFKALDRAVSTIRTSVTDRFTISRVDSLLNDSVQTSMQMQMPITPMSRASKAFDLSDELKIELENATDLTGLRNALSPVIENQIIGARFDEMNRLWHDDDLSKIRIKNKKIEDGLQEAASYTPKEYPAWISIQESLKKVNQIIGEITFDPPQEPNWWISVSGKRQRLNDIGESVLGTLADAFRRSRSIDNIHKEIRSAHSQQKQLQSLLEKKIDKIQEDFENQQLQLSKLNKLFGIISLDLNHFIPMFPLILGIILATTTYWTAYRFRELILLTKMIASDNQKNPLYQWLHLRANNPLLNQSVDGIQKVSKKRNNIIHALFRCLLFWAWIIIACVQLFDWPEVNEFRVIMYALVAAVLVGITHSYRWHVGQLSFHSQPGTSGTSINS